MKNECDTLKHNMLAIDLNCVYITQATKRILIISRHNQYLRFNIDQTERNPRRRIESWHQLLRYFNRFCFENLR